MNKILRYSFVALMAMMGLNGMAQGVTFDFDNDYAKLFPSLTGTSSSDSNDGDFTEATTSTAVDGFTVTVSAAAEGVKNTNRIWSGVPRLRMYSGTFTVSGKGIKKIEFTGHATNFNLSTTTGTLEGKVWTGEADEIVFAVAKNTQINKLVINGDGDPDPQSPTEPDHQNVTIADLASATAKIDNVNLTMTNAQVLYANGARVYVREGDKAILFYSLGINDLKTNALVKGSIKGKLDIYNNLNEFVKTDYTKADGLTITDSETPAEPLTINVADAANYISNLVRFNGVTITDVNGKNATANIGDATLAIYDQFGVLPESTDGKFDITGVITVYKTNVQIYPITITAEEKEVSQGQSWDFTKWSEATVANLKADAAAGAESGWSDLEAADGSKVNAEGNCFWYQGTVNADGSLSANGVVIEELKGLKFNTDYAAKRSLAIAVNYPSTSLGDYAGGAYLWLGGGGSKQAFPCFTIPAVKAGSKITMEMESHKPSDARGVGLYKDSYDAANLIGEQFKPKTKDSHTWEIAEDCDVVVWNTSGCHIYTLKVETGAATISTMKADAQQNGAIYNLAGQKVDASYKGLVIKNGRKYINK